MTRRGLILLFGGIVTLAWGCGRSELSILGESAADDAGSSSGSGGSLGGSSGGSSGAGGSSGSSSGGIPPPCSPAPGLVTLASGQTGLSWPNAITVDATSVYWSGPNTVLKASKCGGAVTTLASGSLTVQSLAVDARNVYFVNQPGVSGTSVSSVPIGGGPVATLAAAPFAQWMAIDATSAYWVSNPLDGTGDSTVIRVPLDGGMPTTLASGPYDARDVVVGSGSVYWSGPPPNGHVFTVPVGGGTPRVFGDHAEIALAMNSANVFWRAEDMDIEAIQAEPIAGGAQVTVASGPSASTGFSELVADDSSLYYFELQANEPPEIVKVPLAGGAAPTTLTSGVGRDVVGIAVDDTSLYWADEDGRIMRLTPK